MSDEETKTSSKRRKRKAESAPAPEVKIEDLPFVGVSPEMKRIPATHLQTPVKE